MSSKPSTNRKRNKTIKLSRNQRTHVARVERRKNKAHKVASPRPPTRCRTLHTYAAQATGAATPTFPADADAAAASAAAAVAVTVLFCLCDIFCLCSNA